MWGCVEFSIVTRWQSKAWQWLRNVKHCPATRREAKFSNGLVALGAVRQWQGGVKQGTAKAKHCDVPRSLAKAKQREVRRGLA